MVLWGVHPTPIGHTHLEACNGPLRRRGRCRRPAAVHTTRAGPWSQHLPFLPRFQRMFPTCACTRPRPQAHPSWAWPPLPLPLPPPAPAGACGAALHAGPGHYVLRPAVRVPASGRSGGAGAGGRQGRDVQQAVRFQSGCATPPFVYRICAACASDVDRNVTRVELAVEADVFSKRCGEAPAPHAHVYAAAMHVRLLERLGACHSRPSITWAACTTYHLCTSLPCVA